MNITDLFKLAKKHRSSLLLVLAAMVGVLLIAAGSIKASTKAEPSEVQPDDDYAVELERRVAALVNRIDGINVGAEQVMISLDDSGENVYAQNSAGSDSRSYVIIGSENALLLKRDNPSVGGVVLICGATAEQRLEITKLLSALFGISSARIYVY